MCLLECKFSEKTVIKFQKCFCQKAQSKWLNFRNASVSHCFRKSLLTIIWNNLGLSDYKHMKKILNLEKNHLLQFKKELFSPLFIRVSPCSNAFVTSFNLTIILERIVLISIERYFLKYVFYFINSRFFLICL